ncbi:MAG: hypothetical protein KTR27_17025 [Leptolyngbyaceae cyanobacterium MAG.088]|nr:hypothetical protein [Leptolyngbyaceae cyanobacterium MAG.088]
MNLEWPKVQKNDAFENVAPELLDDIALHDVMHTVFACPTNLRGEILSHLWSIFGTFGTTLEIKEMHRVNMQSDHRSILKQIGHKRLVKTWFACLLYIILVIWRASKMHRRWPACNFQAYLNRSLLEIRDELNINIICLDGANTRHAALRSIRST